MTSDVRHIRRRAFTLIYALLASGALGAQAPRPLALTKVAPTVDQVLSLGRVGSPEISPDGRSVAYTVRQTNWDENAYETQIWLADTRSGQTRQLTAGKKSSSAPEWSPDGSKLAFTSDRTDKRQIYIIDPLGGDAEPLTAPDGVRIAFQTAMANPAYYYANQVIAVIAASGGTPEPLTTSFDEDPGIVAWKPSGIYFSASRRTWSYLHRVDPAAKTVMRLAPR